jgi:hypothetical protein
MIHNKIITENQLDEWVRGNSRIAQGMVVELVWRLVATSSPNPKERRFPLGDSIGQPGPDGILDAIIGFDPFVPEGKSFWEIGTGNKAGDKATSDYRELTAVTPAEVRRESTFIFVTPLSGRRDWEHTWKEDAQANWLEERIKLGEWRDVRIIDGTKLIDWLHQFQPVELWLADIMGLPVQQMQTPEQRWDDLKTIGDPPPLSPNVFLANRDKACEKLREVFSGITLQLKLDTRSPDHIADFIAAYVASLDEEAKVEAIGRCLIISDPDAWNSVTALHEPHILIADFDFDYADSTSARLLEKARKAGHAVIFGGMPGGIPHPNRVSITDPRDYQIKETLVKAGYKEERARTLAQKSGGSLSSLLRCLQHLSLMPEWAQGTEAAELAIAELLGSWREDSEADKAVVEKLSGKAYGEWIGKMREIALRPGAPLTQRDSDWKVVVRYEAWYALGQKLFDDQLDRLKEVAVKVLRERDPQFDLPTRDRYLASIHGKVLTHSPLLRTGLAESLALLGSHPKALTFCSFGKAETTAILTVREVLADADWVLWASLNDLLPLLAEAAPREFLDIVEAALNSDPCSFDLVFSQEGSGLTGRNYLTGLLWALETLAWDAEYLTRVVVLLGELAQRDPGGNWANRPANSLTTILLPWFPQTCAPVTKRQAAVATLLNEIPDVAWKLLLDVLPQYHQTSSMTRKPTWRGIIPDDWSEGVTNREYWEQIAAYAGLAISAAKQDLKKLVELVDRLDNLPPPARDQLLAHLESDIIVSMPQADRLRLWNELVDLVSRHRKFVNADWAMKPEVVDKIAAVAESLKPDAPYYLHRRLFSERDFDLYEEKGSYDEQRKKLEEQRQKAVNEVFAVGGVEAVLEFAKSVETPWRVGNAFGVCAVNDVDEEILPTLLETETKSLAQFAGGFIWGKFWVKGWIWVDQIKMSNWSLSQIGQFLAYLPFTTNAWERAARLLGDDQSQYWLKANANPYQAENDLEAAIDRLVEYGRANAAVECLERMLYDKRALDSQRVVRVLRAVLNSQGSARSMDVHAVAQIIKGLQDDPHTNPDDLFQIEWAFLPLLDRYQGVSPKLLEQRLAEDPAFFCDVIRLVFRSEREDYPVEEPTELQANLATNAYRLLHGWRTPPGSQMDGTYNGEALTAWLENVKVTCRESGHLEVALTIVGQVLIYTPPDPDGFWIHHSAATALNSKDATKMRNGFGTGLYTSRGVHYVDPTGQAERELAERFRVQAEEVEARGYHRLASSLRELAVSYDREAEWQASRKPFED